MTIGSRTLRIAVPAFAILLLLALCGVAQAADNTYTVNTTDDAPIATPGDTNCVDALDGKCSIRAAIDAANSNPGNDTIVIPAGRYDRALTTTGTDNSSGDFNVANNGTLTIKGQTGDPKDVIVSAAGHDRVLEIDDGGTLTLTGVTFQDGFTADSGAGIYVNGDDSLTTLTLNSSRVLRNVTTENCGGGIAGNQISVITLNSSNVDNNSARECGGGVSYQGTGSILKMFDSSVNGNTVQNGVGGGIVDEASVPVEPLSTAITSANETLHAERSSIDDNESANGEGGGIWSFCECSSSDINLTDSSVNNNVSDSAGGGVYNDAGVLSAVGTTFNNNTSHNGAGGGIWSDGDGVSLSNSTVNANFAYDDGGGICAGFGPLTVDGSDVDNNQSRQQDGGGISHSEDCENSIFAVESKVQPQQPEDEALTVTDSHVDENFAGDFGGGINNSFGNATVTRSTVNNNEARRDKGGGIYNASGPTYIGAGENDITVIDSEVDQNNADLAQGGGIANDAGFLTLIRVSVDRNSAGADGGGVGRGGGVYNNGAQVIHIEAVKPNASLDDVVGSKIVDTSISKNHSYASGGGLWDDTGVQIFNTTIANNVADVAQDDNSHQGGGIFDHSGGMSLTNVTLAGNIVNDGSGGGLWANGGSTLTNTIVADNQANFDPSTSDCGGSSPTSGGHNLDGFQSNKTSGGDQCGIDDGVNGDQAGKDAKLGPVQDNGGPTLTRALLAGSPAIDTADNTVCADLTTNDNSDPHDQRQAHRPAGAACDIGAYEANSLADLSITKSASPDPVAAGDNLTYTLHVTNNGPDPLLSGVTVTDTLPGGVTFVSSSPGQGSCSGTTTVTCDLGGLAAGATATVTIVVKTGSPGTLTNTAVVSGAPTDPDGSNNSATVHSTVAATVTPGAAPQVLGQVQSGPQACLTTPPRTSISLPALFASSDTLRFVGRSIDLRCLTGTELGIKKIQIAVGFIVGSNAGGASAAAQKCRFLKKNGRLGKPRSCKKPQFLKAKRGKLRNGKVPWTFRKRHLHLLQGRYIVIALGIDTNNDLEKKLRTYNKKTFTVH